jgi:4'-phosphopantetheinyl transferase EntD
MIEKLFSRDVTTVVADSEMWTEDLHPQEAEFVRNAVASRRREFAAGRSCARKALHILGVDPQPLLVGRHREPLWPQGVVGSLTHCSRYCAVAVARTERFAGLGIDAEASERLDPELMSVVCTKSEIEWVRKNPPPAHGDWPKVIFSAKESVYKCLFPLVRRALEYHDIEIRLQRSSRRFSVQMLFEVPDVLNGLQAMRGRFEIGPEYTVTGVMIERLPLDTHR